MGVNFLWVFLNYVTHFPTEKYLDTSNRSLWNIKIKSITELHNEQDTLLIIVIIAFLFEPCVFIWAMTFYLK